ncbi:MAG: dynamin family protein [Myxococcota bacterium]|nr:dynamin family protein [Myxococcota bacterium]
MNNPATQAIEILNAALKKGEWLSPEETFQIKRRIKQLQRRSDDPRTFIAFIGEKKAGKTALVKALTGVPLPVAVRECTAAICEIQVGLDWHHDATHADGQIESFKPLDDSKEADDLAQAKENEKDASHRATEDYLLAQKRLERAQQAVIEQQELRSEAEKKLRAARATFQETLGSNPWLWSFLSLFAWLSKAIRLRLAAIEETKQLEQKAEQDLEDADQILADKRRLEQEASDSLPNIWQNSQGATQAAQKILKEAEQAYESAIAANQQKFQNEISNLIDVKESPVERITIHTPNANIPYDVVLLDTPGFNTDLEAHRRRAWEAIEEMADVCILVSDLRQPMPDTALSMLDRLEPFCPYMHVALTKTDLALAEAEDLGEDPEEEVRDAEAVARARIKRHWDRPMNIWTVASINEQDQRLARALFQDFWKQLPKDARTSKSRLLGIHALREFMDILTVHIHSMKASLAKIDEIAADLAYSMAAQLEEHAPEVQERSEKLLRRLKLDGAEQLGKLELKWVDSISNCETKRQLKMHWDTLQKDMPTAYKQTAASLSLSLDQSIRSIAGYLFHGEGELEVSQPSQLQTTDQEIEENNSKTKWLWTAGGMAAGATVALMLSSSGFGLPLLFAAGAGGGVANLLLSPLAKAKEDLQKNIQKSVSKEIENMNQQLSGLQEEVAEKILKAAEKELQKELQKREAETRKKKEDELRKVQALLNFILEERKQLVRTKTRFKG